MKHIRELSTFIILMALVSNAAAVSIKCTDANSKVIYTNTVCPSGFDTKSVAENISVIDGSAERALIALETEKAKAQAASADGSGNEIPATGGLTDANRAKLKDAESLAHTAISAREQMGMAIAIFIGIALILRFFFRRKK